MATTPKSAKNYSPSKDLPPYAVKIRQLRQEARLTQSQLASEMGVRRGAVARWEAGAREPKRPIYLQLSAVASDRHLPALQDFFLSQMEEKNAEKRRRNEEVYARSYLARVKSDAAEKGEQAELARHLLRLSEMDGVELAKLQAQRISEGRRSLSNGAFEAVLFDIVEETHHAKTLQLGRRLEIATAVKKLEQQIEELQDADSLIAENEKKLREKIENILAEAETAIRDRNAQHEVFDILRKIPRIYTQTRRRLKKREAIIDRWLRIQAVLNKYEDDKGAGMVVDDLVVIKELERLLKFAHDANSEEKKPDK